MRGGYGIYFGQLAPAPTALLSYGSQGFNQSTGIIYTYQNDGATPYLHLSNPFQRPDSTALPSTLGLSNDVGYGAVGPLRTHAAARTPYEQTWTLGFEHQLPWSVVVGVNYIGKEGSACTSPAATTTMFWRWSGKPATTAANPNNPCQANAQITLPY